MIIVTALRTHASATKTEELVAGRVGMEAAFHFSPEWDGLGKTAVFEAGGVAKDVIVGDDPCIVPHECMIEGAELRVGIYGMSTDGSIVIPTVYAFVGVVKEGADPSGDESYPPTPDVGEQAAAAASVAMQAAAEAKATAEDIERRADSGEFNGKNGYTPIKGVDYTDGKSAYQYAVEAGFSGSESEFAKNLAAEEVFIGNESTTLNEYYNEYNKGKVVFARMSYAGSGITTWVAASCLSTRADFFRVYNGKIEYATLDTFNVFTVTSEESANVFVGNENTSANTFNTEYQRGKVCFMRRPQGGSGIVTWVAYTCNATFAAFYHVTANGLVEYGRLESNGNWSYQSVEFGGGGGASVELDTTLTQSGVAADAKAVGDALATLENKIPVASGGMSVTAADLLVTILRNAEYSTDQSDNISALATALNASVEPDVPVEPDEPDTPIVVRYAITNTLTECTNSNAATSLTKGESYTATLTANEGFVLYAVTVMMGGVDVTADVYADGVINISSVMGDVIITAVAVEKATYPFTPDVPFATTWTEGYKIDSGTSSATFGENVEDPNLAVSDYLPVSGASAVELSGLYTNYGIWLYTADKTAICRMNINESYPAPVARDAAYVRAQCRVANVGVASVTPKVFDVLGENTAWESGKYYVLDGYEPTAALNANTGAETTSSSWWRSGYCFCYGATEINLTAYLSYRATLVFYDAEKNYISGSTRNIEAAVTVPENAMYFRVSTAMITSYDARFNTDNLWATLT